MDSIARGVAVFRWITGTDGERAAIEAEHPGLITALARASGALWRADSTAPIHPDDDTKVAA